MSSPAANRLAGLPTWATTAAFVVLMVAAAIIGGPVGWVLYGVALAFVAWLLYLAWPYVSLNAKLMRIAVTLLVAAVVLVRLLPR